MKLRNRIERLEARDAALNAEIERELARLQLTPVELDQVLDQVRREYRGHPLGAETFLDLTKYDFDQDELDQLIAGVPVLLVVKAWEARKHGQVYVVEGWAARRPGK